MLDLKNEKTRKNIVKILGLTIMIAVIAFLYFYGQFVAKIIYENYLDEALKQPLNPLVLNIIFLILGTEIFLIISRFFISTYFQNGKKKKSLKPLITFYSYIVWAVVAIIIASFFFKDFGALITSLGLIGFGITFALQKPILNFVGWLMIFLTNPFETGDRVEVSNIRGDILSIHTMYSRIQGIRTGTQEKNDQIITVPNELFLTNPIINYSRRNGLYTDEIIISITYESDWKKAIEIIERVTLNTIKKHIKKGPASFADKQSLSEAISLLKEASKKIKKGLIKQSMKENIEMMKTAETNAETEIPKPNIQLTFADSSINISALYQTDLYSVRATKNEINKGVLEEFEKSKNIEIAYPHMQLVTEKKVNAKNNRKILQFMETEKQDA
ncbi:MAG: mechanosensitive ion channel [Candidatus Diapherotrites archaeon]|nr:mechanosensitive ion channel [Candidatus Diapherotrites archaeon]